MRNIQSALLTRLQIQSFLVTCENDWQMFGSQAWAVMMDYLRQVPPMYRVMGVDAEWFMKNPLATVQISTQTHCFVIHLSYFANRELPSDIKAVFEDRTILKCGVGVSGDAARILKEQKCKLEPIMDVEHFAVLLNMVDIEATNLKALALRIAGIEIEKNHQVTRSNWELQLTDDQQCYAAEDAVASWAVGSVVTRQLVERFSSLWPPSEVTLAGLVASKRSAAGQAYKAAQKKRNKLLNEQRLQQKREEELEAEGEGGGKSPTVAKFVQMGAEGKVKVLSRTGAFLFECSRGKAKYYVQQKGIATVVECRDGNPNRPKVIQFTFDPQVKTRLCMFERLEICELGDECPFAHSIEQLTPEARELFHLKTPSCACCLGTKDLLRHSIVPPSFRKHFPKPYQKAKKSGKIENFVPVCMQCYTFVTRIYDEQVKAVHRTAERRARELGYPASVFDITRVAKCVSYARLLLDPAKLKGIPLSRQEELRSYIATHWRETSLDEMDINNSSSNTPPEEVTPSSLEHDTAFLKRLKEVVPGEVRAKKTMDILLRGLPNPHPKKEDKEEGEGEEEEVTRLVKMEDTEEDVLKRMEEFEAHWKTVCLNNCAMMEKESNLMTDQDWLDYKELKESK